MPSSMSLPSTTAEWNAIGDDYFQGLLGVTFQLVTATEVRATISATKRLLSWNGYLHAASVIGLADSACGYGTFASLSHDATGFTTIELKTNFLRSITEGDALCVATAVHQGHSTQVWDASVKSTTSKKTMALFRCTQQILFATRIPASSSPDVGPLIG